MTDNMIEAAIDRAIRKAACRHCGEDIFLVPFGALPENETDNAYVRDHHHGTHIWIERDENPRTVCGLGPDLHYPPLDTPPSLDRASIEEWLDA